MKSTRRMITAAAIVSLAVLGTLPSFAQTSFTPPSAEDVLVDLDALNMAPEMSLALGATVPLPMMIGIEIDAPDMADGPDFEIALGDGPPGPPISIAAGPGGGPGCPAGMGLTDDQYEKMFELRKASMARKGPKMAEMMTLHMDLQDQLLKPSVDRSKVLAVQSRINALHAELANQKLEDRLAMADVLTPEQRAQMRHFMLKRMSGCGIAGGSMMGGHHMHMRHGGGGHHGMGGHMGREHGAGGPDCKDGDCK